MNKTKVEKQHPDFCREVQTLNGDQLKARIVSLQEQLAESEEHKEANEELRNAKEAVKELSGPYSDVRKAVRAKTSYLLELLKEKNG